jgi:hypothetical protein
MSTESNPTSGRKGLSASLPTARLRSEPGTIEESLREIRELLHDLDGGGGMGPPSTESTPAADAAKAAPRASFTRAVAAPVVAVSDGALAMPALAPHVASPPRRRGAAVAMMAMAGLVVLGAAGLVTAAGLDLPLLAVSASGKKQARPGGVPEIMARAALPPARSVVAAKGNAAPKPPAETGHEAPRNGDTGSWRPPSHSRIRIVLPVVVPGARDRSAREGDGHGRADPIAAAEHDGAAAAPAQTKADLAAVRGMPEQRQEQRFGRRAAPRRTSTASRSSGFSRGDRPARRAFPAIAAGENGIPQSLQDPTTSWPTDENAFPAPVRQSRAALPPSATEVGNGMFGRPAVGVAEYVPAVTARRRRPVDWSDRGFPPGPPMAQDEAAVGAFPFSPPLRYRHGPRAFPFPPPPPPRYRGGGGPPYPPPWRARFFSFSPRPPGPPPPP